MVELLFYVFAALALGGAIGMVTRSNPVASLLFLVLTFFALAAIYILLGAHFIGAVQVILYAGAIMVLFLFVIMLLNLGHDYRADIRGGLWIVLAFATAGIVGYALARLAGGTAELTDRADQLFYDVAGSATTNHQPPTTNGVGQGGAEGYDAVAAIGIPLFEDHLVAFEVTSILLLVAVIGAILLAKRRV
ncbi:MAG: NADH-quinone oxidoreductase subunit J [Longimicrobiales bacterium]